VTTARRRRILPAAAPLLAWLSAVASAQETPVQHPIGVFEGQTGVGEVGRPGSAAYDPERQQYSIAGSGANMWGDRDEFHFVWKRMTGDFILTARAQLVGDGGEPHRKIGWIVRAGLDPGAPHVTVAVHGDSLAALHFRRTAGGPTEEMRSPAAGPDVVQLERRGSTYVMSVARFSDTLTTTRVADVALGDEVYVGLFVCSHDDTVVERATFRDVRITRPAADDFVAYRKYIGSNLEIVDVGTGHRSLVHRSPESLPAPNWTADGRALIYNGGGRLYRFDLATKAATLIDTDFATSNNNDHVLSFDGRTIGISSASADDQPGRSIIYTVPLEGGTPKRVTALGPSYLHGWSPDGKFLVYTGERNGEFDI